MADGTQGFAIESVPARLELTIPRTLEPEQLDQLGQELSAMGSRGWRLSSQKPVTGYEDRPSGGEVPTGEWRMILEREGSSWDPS